MDTTWYAVDQDGFVGAFQTGEDGALPLHAAAGPEGGDFDEWPLDALRIARKLAKGTLPDDSGTEQGVPSRPAQGVLVLLPDPENDSTSNYRDAEARSYSIQETLGDVVVLNDSAPRVVASRRPLSVKLLAKLASDPRIERIIYSDDEFDWEEVSSVFRYGNADYGNPGAYASENEPEDPIALAKVPEEFSAELAKLVIPIRFAETPSFHLADFMRDEDCGTYRDTTLRGEPRDAGPQVTSGRSKLAIFVIMLGLFLLIWWIFR